MKMLQDCNFLDRVEALPAWLGFQASGNPFLLPPQRCAGNTPDIGLIARTNSDSSVGFDRVGLADVGTQPWLGPLKVDIVEESGGLGTDKGTRSKKRRLRKSGAGSSLAPYAAAVVNDPTLLPAVKAPAPAGSSNPDPFGLMNGARLDEPPRTAFVNIEGLVPNLVSREDAQRICMARQALQEEEVRVREAERAAHPADEERDGRRRSRALSTVSSVSSSSARRGSGASASSACGSPTRRRISRFGKQSSRRRGVSVVMNNVDSRASSNSQGSGDMRSIVLATAGLLHHPPAEPHPGLGPVLLQSDRPGGELHPNPFVHTVVDARSAQVEDLELKITIRTNKTADASTIDRCSTAPLAASSVPSGSLRESSPENDSRRPSVNHRRASTAPARILGASSSRTPSFSGQEAPNFHASGQGKSTPRPSCYGATGPSNEEERDHPGSGYSPRGQGLSRKAGAELRALTAAGTAGRRQPPPREGRLRRLARDVARHSAEVRRLVREEEHLRKGLACCGGRDESRGGGDVCRGFRGRKQGEEADGDSDALARMVARRSDGGEGRTVKFDEATDSERGCTTKRMGALLEDKRREIELKNFDLGVKRDELRCLRMAQKQERERQRALEMERRRADLDDGQVCRANAGCRIIMYFYHFL